MTEVERKQFYANHKIPKNWREMVLAAHDYGVPDPPPLDQIKPGSVVNGAEIKAIYLGKANKQMCRYICPGCKKEQIARLSDVRLGRSGRCKECGLASNKSIQKKRERTFKLADFGQWIAREWKGMRDRCRHGYSQRGICIAPRWDKLKAFRAEIIQLENADGTDAAIAFCKRLTLDRIDNNGDYTLNNLRWATQKEQQNNKSTNLLIEDVDGNYLTISQFSEKEQIPYHVVRVTWHRSGPDGCNHLVKIWHRDGEQLELSFGG